jgi:hypothetical protein
MVPSVERILEFRMISPELRAYDYPSPFPHPRDGGEDKERCCVEMQVSQGPREEPTRAYTV